MISTILISWFQFWYQPQYNQDICWYYIMDNYLLVVIVRLVLCMSVSFVFGHFIIVLMDVTKNEDRKEMGKVFFFSWTLQKIRAMKICLLLSFLLYCIKWSPKQFTSVVTNENIYILQIDFFRGSIIFLLPNKKPKLVN